MKLLKCINNDEFNKCNFLIFLINKNYKKSLKILVFMVILKNDHKWNLLPADKSNLTKMAFEFSPFPFST